MPVLFLGIELPSDVKKQLSRYLPIKTRHVRSVSPELFHITLHYLGEVPKERVLASLKSYRLVQDTPRFDVSIHSLGAFGRKIQPSVLWAGVAPSESLLALHNALGGVVEACGLSIDSRPYHPHITLARGRWRSKQTPEDVQSLDAFFRQSFKPISLSVPAFVLFESKVTEHGRAYPVIQRFDLA